MYAYIRSVQESWTELESQLISLREDAIFSFRVMQQRIELQSEDLVELWVVPAGDEANSACSSSVPSPCSRRWSIRHSPVNWAAGSVKLTPDLGAFRVSVKYIRYIYHFGCSRLSALRFRRLSFYLWPWSYDLFQIHVAFVFFLA